MIPSLALLSCESSVFVKENPDRKKKKLDLCYINTRTLNQVTSGKNYGSTFYDSGNKSL